MVNKKKYSLIKTNKTSRYGNPLFQVKANFAFGIVIKGELGGYIELEKQLDHSGNAWVSGDAEVSGDARVFGNARVFGDAWVFGDAEVSARINLTVDIDFELTPRIVIDTIEKAKKLQKYLKEFENG